MTHSHSDTFTNDIKTRAQRLFQHCRDTGLIDTATTSHKLGKAMNSTASTATPVIVTAQVVKSVVDYYQTREQETTKRAQIAADLSRDLAELELAREAITVYMDKAFDERKVQFDRLFRVLDQAQRECDTQGMSATLDALVTLAQSSPFKSLAEIRRLTRTSGFVMEL